MFTVLAVLIIGKGFFVDNSIYEEYFNTYVLGESDFEVVFKVNLYEEQDFSKEVIFDFDNFDYVLLKSPYFVEVSSGITISSGNNIALFYWSSYNSSIIYVANAGHSVAGLRYDKTDFLFYGYNTNQEQFDVDVMLLKLVKE